MIEFLIRATDDGEFAWPEIRADRLDAVLKPNGWNADTLEGWGDYRIRIDDVEISFSGESPGWQVSFEGPIELEKAAAIVATIVAQVHAETGRPIEAIDISG